MAKAKTSRKKKDAGFARVKAMTPQQQIALWQNRYLKQKASYDAARNGDEYKNIWANADRYDADSANSKEVRHSLISRSRYEIGNNGYSNGIAQTYATDVVGCGPALRMQTASKGFNRLIENQWYLWCKAVKFRRKLWCMAHAKLGDGEAFGVIRKNPGISHPIQVDLVLHEAEQVQTPFLPFIEPGFIDGIHFDQFGNPIYYDVLKQHPGTTHGVNFQNWIPEQVPARMVLQWFKLTRPGQHRAVPEMSSTLNLGAASRRWREATLGKAETQSDFTMFLKTQSMPNELDAVDPMSTLDIEKRMMTALPAGYDPFQLENNTPGASYESFHKTNINEQARPKSMPFNKAACDSSSYNYASGRLDHQTYYAELDVDREDCNDLVLDPLFDVWLDLAILRFGWLGGNPDAVGAGARQHLWDWPKHRVADVEAEANANKTKLQSGQISLSQLWSDGGMDLEDEIPVMAATFGVDESAIRQRLLDIVLPPPKQVQPAAVDQMPQEQMPNAKPHTNGYNGRLKNLLTNGHHG